MIACKNTLPTSLPFVVCLSIKTLCVMFSNKCPLYNIVVHFIGFAHMEKNYASMQDFEINF
jgi:hypothetical protein